ncbi:GspH/FimT family pseudopilin [Ramlibacter ginsenosidimutans]|uniref:GspH/FimT family pseudopilin n=1 Tax=Ramlibacter ginsenosidimutans TaxID=502333 RepID=A0A934TXJ0_9BURK|nr:GspH/FimT family pseudopilin [Ramlibacter ginsenosidimutans]
MRLVNKPHSSSGFTLIELMVVVSVIAILAMKGLPALSAYMTNSRIRESANVVVTTAALARTEAIKRNLVVTIASDGAGTLNVTYLVGTTQTSIRSVPVAHSRVGAFTASFDSTGRLTPFGTDVQATVDGGPTVLCSGEVLCPTVHIEPGGMVSLCTSGACS